MPLLFISLSHCSLHDGKAKGVDAVTAAGNGSCPEACHDKEACCHKGASFVELYHEPYAGHPLATCLGQDPWQSTAKIHDNVVGRQAGTGVGVGA